MQHPKGYYLIHKSNTPPDILSLADHCIAEILEQHAQVDSTDYPVVLRLSSGEAFLPGQILQRYLTQLLTKGFNSTQAQDFVDELRSLVGWSELDHTLKQFITSHLTQRATSSSLDGAYSELLHFTCYAAACFVQYGASFDYITRDQLLAEVNKQCPKLIRALKRQGSGKLPPHLLSFKSADISAQANDVFATIKIKLTKSSGANYEQILRYLCAVLECPDFPRSYSLIFSGPDKRYLPIPGLPKNGINQLFACALDYVELHLLIERYARLAMKEFEQYQNVSEQYCALPGTFAVFALGLSDLHYLPLVSDYLKVCDDEHSSLQGKFLAALISKFGFSAQTLPILALGAMSMQNMSPAKDFARLIAHQESLQELLHLKEHIKDYVPLPADDEEEDEDDFYALVWEALVYAIWGNKGLYYAPKLIKAAPSELKELYTQILEPDEE